MFHIDCPRGQSAPWLLEIVFALSGMEAIGDVVGAVTEGFAPAARDAVVELACEVGFGLALALGLNELAVCGYEADALALLAKLWAPHCDRIVACALAACALAGASVYLNGALLATTKAAQANRANSSVQYSRSMKRSKRPVRAGSALRPRRYSIRWWMLPCSQL
jgi:hypothetical protein